MTTLKLLSASLLLGCTVLGATPTKEKAPQLPVLSKQSFDVEGHPESVVVNENGDIFYTIIGSELNPTAKDEDGAIYVRPYGTHVSKKLTDGLHAPKGLLLIDGLLYFTDINMVYKMDPSNGQILGYVDLTPFRVNFLNDLVRVDAGRFVVSATDTNQLFFVDLTTNTYAEIVLKEPLNSPNGMVWEPKTKTLYLCEYAVDEKGKPSGRVLAINLRKREMTEVCPIRGQFDGIALYNETLYVSDWAKSKKPGAIQRIKLKSPRPFDGATGAIDGPADFVIFNHMYVIPGMNEKKIHILPASKAQ